MTTAVLMIRVIGLSHLLQPPLSAWLARRFALREVFGALPPLPRSIATNMGFASIVLPTGGGCLLALFGDEVLQGCGIFTLAWCMAAFWTWRLHRQAILRRFLPPAAHAVLCTIFLTQGPGLALVLVWSRYAASR